MKREYPDPVKRFVVTHVGEMGLRTLTFACQGRWTYATRDEAQATLDVFSGPGGFEKMLTPEQIRTLEVRECDCWPGHFDPIGVYFE